MKQIKLLKISYHNFKGVKDFTIEPDGADISVLGENAVGKTTLFDGFWWLLFGKNSAELSKFNPKPLNGNGEEILGLEPEVEATIQIDSKTTVLRRKLAEVWTKPRGQVEKIRKSDKTELYVDEVPYKLKDYTDFVDSIIDENTFKLLTNPIAFNNLKWQDQRKILLEMVPDTDDQKIISQTKYPELLKDMLADHSADQQRKIISASRKKLKNEIDGLPARVDEANRAMPMLSKTPKNVLAEMLTEYQNTLSKQQADLQALDVSQMSSDARARKAELQSNLTSKQASYLQGSQLRLNDITNDVTDMQLKVSKMGADVRILSDKEKSLSSDVLKATQSKKLKLQEYRQLKVITFDESNLTCPTCGQDYPAEKQEEIRSHFNVEHSSQIETNVSAGKQLANEIDSKQAELDSVSGKLKSLKADYETKQAKLDALNKEYKAQQQKFPPFKETKIFAEYQAKIADCDKEIESGSGSNDEAKVELQKKIDATQTGITDVRNELAKFDIVDKQNQRIAELNAKEGELKEAYTALDKQSFALDDFIRTKVTVLEDQINKMFGLVTFKLFETQKNGELIDICEAMVDGVPYSTDLNNASRINAGLDIINTLSSQYQVAAPIFVDNAESINHIIETQSQQISLIVSDDKELTTKVEVK